MDDLDNEMHEMFISHRDYKATAREMSTIWSGSKMLKFTEFLRLKHETGRSVQRRFRFGLSRDRYVILRGVAPRATLSSAYSTKQAKQQLRRRARGRREDSVDADREKERRKVKTHADTDVINQPTSS